MITKWSSEWLSLAFPEPHRNGLAQPDAHDQCRGRPSPRIRTLLHLKPGWTTTLGSSEGDDPEALVVTVKFKKQSDHLPRERTVSFYWHYNLPIRYANSIPYLQAYWHGVLHVFWAQLCKQQGNTQQEINTHIPVPLIVVEPKGMIYNVVYSSLDVDAATRQSRWHMYICCVISLYIIWRQISSSGAWRAFVPNSDRIRDTKSWLGPITAKITRI